MLAEAPIHHDTSCTTTVDATQALPGTGKHRIDEPIMEDALVTYIREYLHPYTHPSASTHTARRYLMQLIGEYLREEMTLKRFLHELRSITSPHSATPGDIYRWLIQLLIFNDKDPSCKVLHFLLENGVPESDIEYGNVKRLLTSYSSDGQADKKARERTRIRKSVSKGLRNPPNKWTKEESQRLIQLVHDYGDKSWKKIAEHIGGGKTGAQCAQHWKRVLCPVIRKGSWDDEEEMKLFQLVEKYGQSWKNIASEIGSRTDIQCRYQYFKSCMSREVQWGSQENDLLMKKVNDIKLENRDIHWVDVARYMARGRLTKIPRTALECRTRYETLTTTNGANTLSSSSSTVSFQSALPPSSPIQLHNEEDEDEESESDPGSLNDAMEGEEEKILHL